MLVRQEVPESIPVRPEPQQILVEISPGELLDKLTILRIKCERISDGDKLEHVQRELAVLTDVQARGLPLSEEVSALTEKLRAVNETLWEVEDAIRACERLGDFGPGFIDLARSVYRHNDRRGELKRRINDLLGARFSEQKEYGLPRE